MTPMRFELQPGDVSVHFVGFASRTSNTVCLVVLQYRHPTASFFSALVFYATRGLVRGLNLSVHKAVPLGIANIAALHYYATNDFAKRQIARFLSGQKIGVVLCTVSMYGTVSEFRFPLRSALHSLLAWASVAVEVHIAIFFSHRV